MPKKGEMARKIKELKAGNWVRPPKNWWDKIVGGLKETYPRFSEKRIARIGGGIWSGKPKNIKISIVKKWQK